jgi:hypothetical protein
MALPMASDASTGMTSSPTAPQPASNPSAMPSVMLVVGIRSKSCPLRALKPARMARLAWLVGVIKL